MAQEDPIVEDSNNENVDSTNTTSTESSSSSPTSAVANVYAKQITNKDFDTDEDATMSDTVTASNNNNNAAVVFSPELLKMYYARLFPFELLHSWLAYDPTKPVVTKTAANNNNNNTVANPKYAWMFARREFSMTIEPTPGEEIYIRYQSFASQAELTAAILKRRPTKIDLGAIFSHPPKDHKTLGKNKLQPVQRELVFDIDLTDYDDIRHCGCTGAKICPKCWVFMTMAVEVLQVGLEQDFGFNHVAWFYSGRRGIHAWVCDDTARQLTNEARNAVATYFEVCIFSTLFLYFGFGVLHCHCLLAPSFAELRRDFIICLRTHGPRQYDV